MPQGAVDAVMAVQNNSCQRISRLCYCYLDFWFKCLQNYGLWDWNPMSAPTLAQRPGISCQIYSGSTSESFGIPSEIVDLLFRPIGTLGASNRPIMKGHIQATGELLHLPNTAKLLWTSRYLGLRQPANSKSRLDCRPCISYWMRILIISLLYCSVLY